MSNNEVNRTRRNLILATSALGGAGMAAAAWPFIASMSPSDKAKGLGAPVEVDISTLEPGAKVVFKWRGQPVWVVYRTKEMLDGLAKVKDKLIDPDSNSSKQPGYAKNVFRATKKRPEILVLVGLCTHLGCSPSDKLKALSDAETGPDWQGGFYCPCHGSRFDLAGRVYKTSPAPINLPVPPYTFLSETRILIGEESKGA
ncbi:MAG: ubiquinol-cytochrome c reductase iron-sulfur subunit [Burkholderiales bacterium]|nr:ubiquinol-cytochrome c reductase iron-sulfur subunit [Burkholderiales bacterium]